DIFSFKNKVEEIKNYLKENSYHHQGRVNGILNLIEKIMQRMHILNKDLFSINFYCSDEYLTEKIDYLKFCYEHHRARWEKSYHDGENTANYYELLNGFENILYDAIFILDKDKLAENLRFNDIAIILQDKENISERSTSGVERLKSKKMLIKNLDLKLTELRNHTAQLRNFTKRVVLNRLADDMYQLIEHIEEVAQNLSEEMHEMEFLSSDFEDEQSEAFESSRVSTKEIQRSNASISSMYRFFSTVDEDNRPEKQNRSTLLQQATVS
ncbi:hypothetical protein, partial [Rickettsiella grylli]|uniref:hypothetical protein n=1 Tax=Rickettsiella grylli TaxID=59196 RepID=UPI000B1462CD